MTLLKYRLLILVNAAGVLVSIYSLFFTERLNNFILHANLICDINKTVSCSNVYLSGYAFIFNLPISLFALLFFWFVLSFLIINRIKETPVISYQMLSIINTVALINCIYFLYVLIFILKNICISCLLIDFCVFLNFILLFSYFRRSPDTPKFSIPKLFIGNWIFLLSFIILFVSGVVLYKTYLIVINGKNKELLEEFYLQQPKKDIPCNNSIVCGNINGKVKIRIFNDFLCSYCKLASERYREIFDEDTTVGIEFICYPLNYRISSKNDPSGINVFVSRVMLAASREKEFWDFHDLIIKQSDDLDSAKVFEIAGKTLSNFEGFKENFITEDYTAVLEENISCARQYNVSGTPAIFINGREFLQWTNINLLKMIVSYEINNKH
jgi:uncharacterized membrane protein